jgi:zinc protease
MKVFVEASPKVPIVSMAIAFQSGSTHDPVGKEGLSRATARMLRRGCEGLSADEIEEEVDALGGEFGCDASTSATSAHAEVISRNLDPFVELISRVLGKPSFDEEESARFFREAKAEIVESRDNDRVLASRSFRRTLFEGHPYARRVAGTMQTLEVLRPSDMRAHFEQHMTRQNAVVAISGDVTDKVAHEIAERALSKLPEGKRVVDVVPEPAPSPGRRLVLVDKPDRTQTQMVVGWLGTHPSDQDHFAWIVGNTTFGGTFTSRLMQEIRAKRGWSYGANSRVGFDRHRDAFVIWSAPSRADAPACLELELELLEVLRRDGLTSEELTFTKNYLARSHAFEIDTARKRVHQRLEEALYDLPEGYHSTYLERLAKLELDEVNQALAKRTPFEDLVVAVVATDADSGAALETALGRSSPSQVPPRTVFAQDFE